MGLPFKLKNFMLFKDGNNFQGEIESVTLPKLCLLYTSPSPRDKRQSRMPSSA